MSARRQRFLTAMSRCKTPFGAGTDERDYVEPPRSEAARRIVARAEIDPNAVQFLVGGMGYGKTTQLRKACRTLSETGEMTAAYVDVAEQHDLRRLTAGVVTAAVASILAQRLPTTTDDEQRATIDAIQHWAHGRWIAPWDEGPPWENDGRDEEIWERGVLVPPVAMQPTPIQKELEYVVRRLGNVVVFVDGLDRVQDQKALALVLANDVATLRSAGVGLVIACAAWQRFGAAREAFDAEGGLLSLAAYNPKIEEHRTFLAECIRRRVEADLLSDEVLDALVTRSGGVMRDLFQLTAALIEESYLRGDDALTLDALEASSTRLGHRLLTGLSRAQINRLREVVRTDGADLADQDVLVLLAGGQLIYRADSGVMFVVHPTIVPLLARRASAA